MTIQFEPPYSAQGDLNIFVCDAIPNCNERSHENGEHILAHSETGHNHVISAENVQVFEQDDFVSFMEVKKTSDIIHLRSFHTHETMRLPPGKYRITRQREYTPEGFRRAAD